MESRAVVETLDALDASSAALRALVDDGEDPSSSCDRDQLREWVDACLDGLAEVARHEAGTAALKVRLLAEIAEGSQALAAPNALPQERLAQEMDMVCEVACVLTVSERTASALLAQSHELTTALPLTLAALAEGSISWQHARAMVDEAGTLDQAGVAALEAHFLDPDADNPARGCSAGELVPSRFQHKARTWRERHHPDSLEKRHITSFLDRRLEYAPDRDGMAWLSAYLPADQAAGIWDRTTAAARALQGPAEGRILTQLRVDSFATWILSTGAEATADDVPANDVVAGRVPSPRAQVLVTVPVFALLGLTDEPAMLDGYGPIPPSMARQLIADGTESFHRVLTDPRDGAPLEIGRTSYRLTKAHHQWLRLRDGKCPFPGCSNHSLDNEADHLLAWARGGTTGISNLGQPCHKHHRLKHTSGWTPKAATKAEPPGWISPTGRHYQSEHPDWEPPAWPPQILEVLSHQEPGSALPDDTLPESTLPECSPLQAAPAEPCLTAICTLELATAPAVPLSHVQQSHPACHGPHGRPQPASATPGSHPAGAIL